MWEIIISVGEYSFEATLLEKKAPKTCKALLELLPIKSDLHHAKIAGNEVFAAFPQRMKLPYEIENRTYVKDLKPGDITFSETNLVMAYGEVANEPMPLNLFARVTNQRELKKMKNALRSVWWKNGQKIVLSRKK